MQLINFTKMTAGSTTGLRSDAREVAVVVVKGTFLIPVDGGQAELCPIQQPLIDADVFSGEPGFSAPLQEVDFAPFKPRCDVLLAGSAYAPGGHPAQRVSVALCVAAMAKTFNVIGHRVWTRGMASLAPSVPEFFLRLPISYDNAFGGIDATDPDKPRYFAANHAGKGFSHHMNLDKVIGQPLPNTEEIDNPVGNPRGSYKPMSYGPVGRGWEPRAKLAGTYDQAWIDTAFPFLPKDFKEDYYQAAPPDQQIPHLTGGETISLHNLTPTGKASFQIPKIELPITFHLEGDEQPEGVPTPAALDTLILEPDQGRFSLVWRAHRALRRNLFEIRSVVIGKPSRAYEIAQSTGKPFYRSLGDLVAAEPEVFE